MSVQTEIDRIITAVQAAHEKVAEKGGTTTQPYLVGNLASAINTIPNATDPVLQAKTVTPTTAKQTVTADSGYDGLSKVEVNAMPTATQATPSITVSSGGLITAKSTQTAGYVASGTKQATKQLTTQAAKTVTPTTSNQTAVASGRYTTGAVTVKGDANLVAGNIKKGVSIFGVTGTHEGGTTPTGTLNITENGTYDVTEYASASVNVAGSGGGGASVETCTVTITAENGILRYSATKYVDGAMVCEAKNGFGESEITLDNIVKGSCLTVTAIGVGSNAAQATNSSKVMYYVADMDGFIIQYFEVTG